MKVLVLLVCFLLPMICLPDDWTPPENPIPSTILQEATEDTVSGDYKVALAKHVWYHENAIAIDPAQSGVRLSFALGSWLELGERYPPALEKMREVRELTEKKIRDGDRVRVQFSDFHDFVSLNSTLRQNERTVELFKWLHEDDAEDATRIYPLAESALVKHEEYEICGKYIDPEEDVKQIGESYISGLDMAEQFGEMHQKYVEKRFVNQSAILVGILVKNDLKDDAKTAADALKEFVTDESTTTKLEKVLESAMKGIIPNPWP